MARMSQDDLASDRPAAAPIPAATPAPRRAPAPAPRRGGALALALLLSLLALGLAGYVAWRQWQQIRGSASDNLDQRVGQLEDTVNTIGDERTVLRQRLGDAEIGRASCRERV